MKVHRVTIIKLLSVVTLLLMFSSSNQVTVHAEEELVMDHGAMHAPDLCTTPTKTLTISVPSADQVKFDKSEYKVDKDTCYKFTFSNPTGIEHDVTVDAVAGEIGFVHMHVINATVGPNGDGSVSQNVMTPNKDVTYPMFCEITGHRAAGMESKLIVGNGSSSGSSFLPGFGFYMAAISIFAIGLVVRQRKLRLR